MRESWPSQSFRCRPLKGAAELAVGAVGQAVVAALHGQVVIDFEDVADVDKDVAAHGEGELGLADGFAFEHGDEQGAGVEDADEGGEPVLVVVLGAVVAEDGVGDVGFEDFGGPAFPFDEQVGDGLVAAGVAVTAEELAGAGRVSRRGRRAWRPGLRGC